MIQHFWQDQHRNERAATSKCLVVLINHCRWPWLFRPASMRYIVSMWRKYQIDLAWTNNVVALCESGPKRFSEDRVA